MDVWLPIQAQHGLPAATLVPLRKFHWELETEELGARRNPLPPLAVSRDHLLQLHSCAVDQLHAILYGRFHHIYAYPSSFPKFRG